MNIETCCNCQCATGRAGAGDGSLYAGDYGPYCEGCWGDVPDMLADRIEELQAAYAEQSVEFAKCAEFLTEETARADALSWQPIETAPKDGTNILVGIAGLARSVGESYWRDGAWRVYDVEDHEETYYTIYPTHWMRLPKPPEQKL